MIPHATTKRILQQDNSGKEANFIYLQEQVKLWKHNCSIKSVYKHWIFYKFPNDSN